MANIKLFKLINGDMVIADTKTDKDGKEIVSYPMTFAATGESQMVLIPYNPFGKNLDVPAFDKSHVLFVDDVRDEIKNQYQQITGKVITPKTGLIVP